MQTTRFLSVVQMILSVFTFLQLLNELDNLLAWCLACSEFQDWSLGKVTSLTLTLLMPALLGGEAELRLLRFSLKILELAESCFLSLHNSWPWQFNRAYWPSALSSLPHGRVTTKPKHWRHSVLIKQLAFEQYQDTNLIDVVHLTLGVLSFLLLPLLDIELKTIG